MFLKFNPRSTVYMHSLSLVNHNWMLMLNRTRVFLLCDHKPGKSIVSCCKRTIGEWSNNGLIKRTPHYLYAKTELKSLPLPRLFCQSQIRKEEKSAVKFVSQGVSISKRLRQHSLYQSSFYSPGQPCNHVVKEFVQYCDQLCLESPWESPSLPNQSELKDSDSFVLDSTFKKKLEPIFACIETISNEDLLLVLQSFTKFSRPQFKEKDYYDLWTNFDKECIRRADNRWKDPIVFKFIDVFQQLGLSNVSNCHWLLTKALLRKVDNLTRVEFIKLCGLLMFVRRLPSAIKFYDFEFNIPRILDMQPSITTLELAAICQIFFKLKLVFHDKDLVIKMIEIVNNDIHTIESEDLVAICKSIGLAKRLPIGDNVEMLLRNSIRQLSRLNVSACSALLHLAVRHRVKDQEFLNVAFEKLLGGNIQFATINDVLWISEALGSFVDEDNHHICEHIASHIRDSSSKNSTDTTKDMLHLYNRKLVVILNNLAASNFYPIDLISTALSEDALKFFYGKMFQYVPEVLFLNENLSADVPSYNESRLSEKTRGYLLKKNMEWVESMEKRSKIPYHKYLRDVYATFVKLCGTSAEQYLHLCNILPHHKTIEILFCTNENGTMIPVPESFRSKVEYLPKQLTSEDLQDGIIYHVFIMFWWDVLLWKSDNKIGEGLMRKRQIDKLGYKTYDISHRTWLALASEESKLDYIRQLTQSSMNKKIKSTEEQ